MKDRLQRPRRCQNGAAGRYNMPLVETANSQHTVRTVVRASARWHHLISCYMDQWRQNRLRWSQPQVADSMSPNMKCFWYMCSRLAERLIQVNTNLTCWPCCCTESGTGVMCEFCAGELLRPVRGAVWHEKTERRLRKLGQVDAEGTAPLPHYAPGAESLSEVRTRGASCRREAACVEQGRVHGFYNNLFGLPTDAHMPCLAAANVIRSSGNMPCRYVQALAVHSPLFCMSMQRPRETPKVEKGCGNSTDVWERIRWLWRQLSLVGFLFLIDFPFSFSVALCFFGFANLVC
ncbi:hypothetical protein J3F84DRAFT_136331 [Trichoderma pleuroticola]